MEGVSGTQRNEFEFALRQAIEEEHYFLDAHHKHVSFYGGFATAVVAAFAVGIMRADTQVEHATLLLGPIILLGVSQIAIWSAHRAYQRFLEAVTWRAKLEQDLGWTEKPPEEVIHRRKYWKEETYVPERYLESRRKRNDSREFVEANVERGAQANARRFFRFIQGVSIASAAWLGWLAYAAP